MARIVLRPGNPRDITPEELTQLVIEIQHLSPDNDVSIDIVEQKGYAVTWWEVLRVYVPWHDLTSAVAGALVKILIDWARERFTVKPGRPKSITIDGPHEKPITTIQLNNAESEPEIRGQEEQK